jgi:hypothetical protein
VIRANGVAIARFSCQTYAQPVILAANVVFHEDRHPIIGGNEHIHSAVIVEIPKRQAAT